MTTWRSRRSLGLVSSINSAKETPPFPPDCGVSVNGPAASRLSGSGSSASNGFRARGLGGRGIGAVRGSGSRRLDGASSSSSASNGLSGRPRFLRSRSTRSSSVIPSGGDGWRCSGFVGDSGAVSSSNTSGSAASKWPATDASSTARSAPHIMHSMVSPRRSGLTQFSYPQTQVICSFSDIAEASQSLF